MSGQRLGGRSAVVRDPGGAERGHRRLGEMIAEQKRTVGLAKPGPKKIGSEIDPNATPPQESPTLADVGVGE